MWNQKNIKISQINKRGMDLESKYRLLKSSLESPTSQSINCHEEKDSYYYFKALAQLNLDILLEENQINELKKKIEFMKSKYTTMSAKYAVKKKKEDQKRIIHCEHEDCNLTFIKDKELHYHKLFQHDNDQLMNNQVFSFRVEEEDKE